MKVPEYGAMTTLDATTTVHINLMVIIVLWSAAAVVVVVYGPLDLSRRPRQVAGESNQGNFSVEAGRSQEGCPV
jgi:hypothetical protein